MLDCSRSVADSSSTEGFGVSLLYRTADFQLQEGVVEQMIIFEIRNYDTSLIH
jgi:hypothetical protein